MGFFFYIPFYIPFYLFFTYKNKNNILTERQKIMELIDKDFKTYTHPLLINGQRYLLNRNPFEYAKEGVKKYWPEKIEEKMCELLWGECQKGVKISPLEEKLEKEAIGILATSFLKEDLFLDYFKNDGGDYILEVKPIHIFPDKINSVEEERELA